MNTEVPKADNKDIVSHIIADKKDNTSTVEEPYKSVIPPKTYDKPVMTSEAAAYPKLKKIKAELDNQNNLIFQAEQQRGNLEIELSDLKGLAKITRKTELQRKIDEKIDYINRLKIGLSNMVRIYGFENMNEFYLNYKDSKLAYDDYRHKIHEYEQSYDNSVIILKKAERISEKLTKSKRETTEIKGHSVQIKKSRLR